MQAQREVPADLENCRDKFLVQNTVAEKGEGDDVPALFTKDGKKIQETKLKVVFTEAGGLRRACRKIKRRTEAGRV